MGGDRLMFDPRRSCGPILECRRTGKPPPGVPPGELAQDGATRILGVIKVLSDRRLLVKALCTFKKLLSFIVDVNHPPKASKKTKGARPRLRYKSYQYFLIDRSKVLRTEH